MRYRIILFFIATFLLPYSQVSANLVINEIMYDLEGTDTGREWIEIYNNSDAQIDLSTYKFFEADTNHGLTLSQGNKNISAKGYALIVADPATFKIDWPSFSGTIFDSSFSLGNEGEKLAIKDANLNIVDEYTYSSNSGGLGNGKSLQLVNGSWAASTPTVGSVNQISLDDTEEDEEEDNSSNSNNEKKETTSTTTKKTEEENIASKVKLTAPKIAFIGVPFDLKAEAVDKNGKEFRSGRYFWNFGDGNGEERKSSASFSYTYFYEGDYHISLEYYLNNSSKTPDSVLEATVKVIPLDISISKVGDQNDFFVEINNNTSYDVDISGWVISSIYKTFVFPRNTSILSKKKMMLSSKITNFDINDGNSLKLSNQSGGIVFDYNSKPSLVANPVNSKPKATTNASSVVRESVKENKEEETFVPIENLGASPVLADFDGEAGGNSYIWIFSFVILLGLSGAAVYFIRKRKNVLEPEENFDMLDE